MRRSFFSFLQHPTRWFGRQPYLDSAPQQPSLLQRLIDRLGLRPETRSASQRPSAKSGVERLEEVLAPGNLLSTTSVLPPQVAPNIADTATLSPAADVHIDYNGLFDADTTQASLPPVPLDPQAENQATERSGDDLEKSPSANATDANGKGDPFLDARMKPPTADGPNKDVETSGNEDRGGGGVGPSSGGNPAVATAAGSGEGSQGGAGTGNGGNASASQPAAQPTNPSQKQGGQFWMTLIGTAGSGAISNTADASAAVPPTILAAAANPPTVLAAASPPSLASTAAAGKAAPTVDPAPQPQPQSSQQSPANNSSGGLTAIDPSITAVEGSGFTGTVAQFSDSDGNTNPGVYTVSINFGDGTSASGGGVSYANGVFSVQSGHFYSEEGSYNVATTVFDTADNSTVSIGSPATVTDAPLSGSGQPISANPGQAFTAPVATFSDANPGGVAGPGGDYSATINWGDNTPSSAGTISGGNGNFQVSGPHTYANPGNYSVTISVTDDGGATITLTTTASVTAASSTLSWVNGNPSLSWSVTSTNGIPGITNPGNQSSTEGNSVSLPISAGDTDGDTLSFAAVNLPDGLSISSSGLISGTIAYTAAESSNGSYPTTILVADGHGGSTSITYTWTVADSNQLPTLTAPANQSNVAGDMVSVQLQASDANGDQLLYSATGLPPGLTIDGVTGEIYGTIDPSADFNSPYAVTVTAANQTKSASQTFTWAVTEPSEAPLLPALSDQSNAIGDPVSVLLSATDPNGDPLSYTATGLPPGVSLDPSSGQLTGNIDPSAVLNTPYLVTVQASNGAGSTTQTFHWTIVPVSVTAPGDQVNVNGDAVSLQVSASDAENRPLTYSAVGLPAGLSISSSGLIAGTLSTTADGSSPYTTTVTATAGSDSASQSFTWTVGHFTLAALPDRSDVEGTSVSVPVSASDADHDALSYSASGLPPGISINAATGLLSGVLGTAASGGGPYTVTVTASDGSHSSSQSFTWTVTPHLLLAVPTAQTNAPGDVVSLSLTAVDVANQPVTYSATGLPPGLSLNSSGLIAGTLSASADVGSPYSVTVTATEGGYSSSQTFVWNISRVVIAAVGDQSNMAGDSVSLPLSGRNADNAALTWSVSGLPSGLSINSSTGLISGTVAAGADVGSPYAVTVTASEGSFSSSQTLAWTVSAAVVFADPGDQSNVGGDSVSLPITATDNHGGTLFYTAVGLPAGLSIDPNTGIIGGTLAAAAVSATPYDVIVSANDGSYGDSQEFNWTVAASGVLNPGAQSSLAGSTVSLSLAAADAAGHALTYSAVGLPPGLSLNSSSGLISGTIPTTAAGNRYAVTVTVSDGTTSSSQSFEWEVTSLSLSSPGDQTSTEGVPVSLTLTAQDASGRTLTYTASGLPAGLSINASNGLISGTTPVGQGSSDSSPVTVTVSDGLVSVSQTFNWAVLSVAALDNPGAQTNAEGDAVSLQLNGAGDGVTFSAVGLPAGLSIDSNSGLITGSIGYGAAEVNGGTYTATVTAQDDLGHSVSQSFTWTVSDSHFAAQGVDVSAIEGTLASVPVANFSVDDTTLLAAAFTATVDWGDGTTPTAATVSGSAGTFAVSAPHSYASAGVDTVSTTISGPQGTLTTTSTAVVDDAALLAAGSNLSAVEGATLANATLASFVDPATPDSLGSDTATIDWGDGSTGTGTVSGSGTTVYVSGSHAYAQAGNYQATITLQTGGGDDESATALVTVADAALTAQGTTANATEGQMASLTLASFGDLNANALNGDFQVSINWGDGTPLDSADAVNGSPSAFSVSGSHPYAESGNFVALVTIVDAGGATATASTLVTVADAALTASGNAISTTVGQPLGNEPVATFVDANPASQASDFTVSIDWGNGATSPGQIMGSGGEFAIYNDYVYQQPGTYGVTVTILEDGQTVATASSTATVGTLVEGQTANLTVMSFNDSNPSPPSSYTATIAWGDGTSSAGTVTGNGPYSVQGSHAYASPGPYVLVITVSKGSSTLSGTGSVVVADAPLTVFAANVSTVEGRPLTNVPVAIFVDADPSASPTESVPTILWGDGTAASAGTVVANGPIDTVFASHPYARAGSYPIQVLVAQLKGLAVGASTALVEPNWNDTTTYYLNLDVGLKGLLNSTLPGNTPNGVGNYLPGDYGNLPDLQAPWWRGGQFQPQQVNLYLAGLGTDLAKAAGVKQVSFAFAKAADLRLLLGKLGTLYQVGTSEGQGPYSYEDYAVSALPGYAGNATTKAITPGPGRTDAADYSFAAANDQFQAAGTIGEKVTTVPLYVKDYGGEAVVTATLLDKNNKVLHTFALRVPVDPFHTGIAYSWTVSQYDALGGKVSLGTLFNPNWDEAPFPNMTNAKDTTNDPLKFPTKGLETGDGLPLWYKYRGVLVGGGGFDPNGKNPQKGFVRLSAAVKNVLLDVDTQGGALKSIKATQVNTLHLRIALDMVSKAYSQAKYGAGVRLYYLLGPTGGVGDGTFTVTPGRDQNKMRNDLLTQLSSTVNLYRKSYLRVDIHQYWRHLTIAQTLRVTGLTADGVQKLLHVDLSGYSNSATTIQALRSGSFLFFDAAQNVFRTTFDQRREAYLKAMNLEQQFSFDKFAAGVIIHELAHQLTKGEGHYADSTGDNKENQADDFASVQFDYTQAPLPAGYNYQDYYPLPGQTFQFGHAFKSARGTVITNMQLKNSFLPPYKEPVGMKRIGG